MHGRVSLATLAAALLLAAPASCGPSLREPRRQPGRRGRPGRGRQLDAGCRCRAGRSSRRSPRSHTARPASSTTEDGTRLGGGATSSPAGRTATVNAATQVIDVSRGGARDRPGRRHRDAVGADRRLREPGRQRDRLGAAARRGRDGDRAADGAPGRRRRPSARASRTCCRETASVVDPARHARDPRHDHRNADRRAVQRRLRRQRQLQLRRPAGGGQERRRAGRCRGTVLVKVGRQVRAARAGGCSRTAPRSTPARAWSRSRAPTAASRSSTTASSSSPSPAGSRR